MEKTSTPRPSRRPTRPGATPQQVRATLDDIRRIIGVDSQPVAKVLPEAIAQATEERGAALEAALEPTVARTIRVFSSRNPHWFGELLAPTIGVAVRKAVSEVLAALMQRFDEALERSLSLRSFRWRLEAHRTGLSFAEVILLRTLVYRVEQVFLIHSETGLVLQHVVAEGVPFAHPDQVASMLAAIDAYGREAFSPNQPGSYLREFSIGDLTVWVDRVAPIAVALVIRGRAPRSLLEIVVETRERILLDYRESLERFQADTTAFRGTAPILERCLRRERKHPPHRGWIVLVALALAIVVALGAVAVGSHNRNLAQQRQLSAYRQVLSSQPGIIVTSASRDGGHFRLTGLRDPMAPEPSELVAGLAPGQPELSFEPFYSLDSRLVESRFRRMVAPPATVTVAVRDGTLQLVGDAPREWIDRALTVANALPGVERVASTLSDPTARELGSATRELRRVEVSFAAGSAELDREARASVARALELIRRIDRLSAGLEQRTCLRVIGDADASGSSKGNTRLARERARVVGAVIRQRSALGAVQLEVRGRRERDALPRGRSVHFEAEADTALARLCGEGVRR